MVTKEQLIAMHGYGKLHYTGRHDCTKHIGPRGGVTYNVTNVRLSGQCKTWKRNPERFYQLVKYGLYESAYIDEINVNEWHEASECPLNNHPDQIA